MNREFLSVILFLMFIIICGAAILHQAERLDIYPGLRNKCREIIK